MADVRWMTYTELAEALGIAPDSARNLVRRKRWSRQTGNDGLARIGVPVDYIVSAKQPVDAPLSSVPVNPPIDPPSSLPIDGGLMALQVLQEHIGRLEGEIVSLKEERDRERARAAQVEALNAIIEMERKRSNELKQERDKWAIALHDSQQQLVEIARKPRGLWAWLRG